jgi:hypothetical protein
LRNPDALHLRCAGRDVPSSSFRPNPSARIAPTEPSPGQQSRRNRGVTDENRRSAVCLSATHDAAPMSDGFDARAGGTGEILVAGEADQRPDERPDDSLRCRGIDRRWPNPPNLRRRIDTFSSVPVTTPPQLPTPAAPIHRHQLRVWGVHLMAKHQADGDTQPCQMLVRGRSGVPRSAQAPGHPMGAETLRLLTRGSPAGLQMGVLPVRDESHAAARPRVAFCVVRVADARSRAAVPVQPSSAATCIPCGIAGSATSIIVATGYAHASTAKAPAGR